MDIKILRKYLPEELIEYASKFDIPEEFLEIDAELIILILQSKALETDEEKQNWFNLLPLMTEEQNFQRHALSVRHISQLSWSGPVYAESNLVLWVQVRQTKFVMITFKVARRSRANPVLRLRAILALR